MSGVVKYYVCEDKFSRDELADWAEANGMCLNGAELILGSCGRVYGLDIWNKGVTIPKKLQGAEHQKVMNGTKQIGIVYCNSGVRIILPAIRDR